jgi:hypothetical protein
MIRAHSPGLQVENQKILITNEDIAALYGKPVVEPSPASRSWHMPPIEGGGPLGMVHCPTSLAGVTFYYYQGDRAKKFITPHQGPWAAPEMVNVLGDLCNDLSKEGVVGIEHIGIYNPQSRLKSGNLSAHGYGLGIDISGFQFSDGRVIEIVDHDDPAARTVLEHIRDAYLKKYFKTVLDWHYQNHNDHFHCNLPFP